MKCPAVRQEGERTRTICHFRFMDELELEICFINSQIKSLQLWMLPISARGNLEKQKEQDKQLKHVAEA